MSCAVSIIIPTYNGEKYVGSAVKSAFEQTLLPEEVIIVDDCSTDETVSLVRTLSVGSPVPLRVIRLAENSGGPARPINVGIEVAQGELIAILDQDDQFLPDTLERHTAALAAHPAAGFSFSYGAYLEQPEQVFQPEALLAELKKGRSTNENSLALTGDEVLRELLKYGNFVRGFPGFVFRRSMWDKCGPVTEARSISGDLELLCAMSNDADVACVLTIGYLRREHNDNMCRDEITMHEEVIDIIVQWLQRRPDYLQEADVCAAFRSRIVRFTRMCRAADQYRRAFRVCEGACRIIGWDRSTRVELAKVLIQGAAYTTGTDSIARDIWSARKRWRHRAVAQ